MIRWFPRVVAASLGVALCCATGSLLWTGASVRSADRNGDGRPDIWRTYDRAGHMSEVAIDTNYDGRVDRREFYENGALVRRESDRDFNDRVDLVQTYDPRTRQPVRTVADVDFDGVADLLVLFRDSKVVLSKWSHAGTPGPQRFAGNQLAPFVDPFLGDLALREVQLSGPADSGVVLSTFTALPAEEYTRGAPIATAAATSTDASLLISLFTPTSTPRAPPSAHSLA